MLQEGLEFPCYFDDKLIILQLKRERVAGKLLSVYYFSPKATLVAWVEFKLQSLKLCIIPINVLSYTYENTYVVCTHVCIAG